MAITDLGKAVPVFKGAFNLAATYEKLDIVTSAGSSYVAKLGTTGNALSNGTYWALLAQAGDYAGTAIGVCGENLFHNWDFRNPVNQRGVTGAIATAGYFYDRWMLNSGYVVTAAEYLTVAGSSVIEQRIEGNSLADTEVTVSVDIEGTIVTGSGSFPNVAGTAAVTLAGFGTATLGYAVGYVYVRLAPNADRNVVRVKLELGTVSTLDRQPPMDYTPEFLKCSRFAIKPRGSIRSEYWNTGIHYCRLVTPVPLRTDPSHESGTFATFTEADGASALTAVTGFAFGAFTAENCTLVVRVTKSVHGLFTPLVINLADCVLSADL